MRLGRTNKSYLLDRLLLECNALGLLGLEQGIARGRLIENVQHLRKEREAEKKEHVSDPAKNVAACRVPLLLHTGCETPPLGAWR